MNETPEKKTRTSKTVVLGERINALESAVEGLAKTVVDLTKALGAMGAKVEKIADVSISDEGVSVGEYFGQSAVQTPFLEGDTHRNEKGEALAPPKEKQTQNIPVFNVP